MISKVCRYNTRIIPRTTFPKRPHQISAFLVSSHKILSLRYNSSTTSTSKTLKSASFAVPKDPPPPKQEPNVPQQDIDDFRATKLIQGMTDLHLAITSRASDKLNSIAAEEPNPQDCALMVSIQSGGCHGFQYDLHLSSLSKELAENEDLLVFERESGGKIMIDESSLEILQDSKLDYTKELIGSQFKIVDSPYTSSSCGCGSSFEFDFDKLAKKKSEEAAT